jgi:hypothetical protein
MLEGASLAALVGKQARFERHELAVAPSGKMSPALAVTATESAPPLLA